MKKEILSKYPKMIIQWIIERGLIPIENFQSEAPLRIRGIGTKKEAIVMVANYTYRNKSEGDVETEITFKDARKGQNVIDLETGEVLGKFSRKNKSFPISINLNHA